MRSAIIAQSLERSRERNVLFALELLDAVTLERLNDGIQVQAQGLQGNAVSNSGNLFVWLKEDPTSLATISINAGDLPYQGVELDRSQIQFPLTTVHMAPRVNYPFQAGVTGVRAMLVESKSGSIPVLDAKIHLRWLNDQGIWQDAAPFSQTSVDKGGFVAILRLLPGDAPELDSSGALSVRLRASRPSTPPRDSTLLNLIPGRLLAPMTFAWDELQP